MSFFQNSAAVFLGGSPTGESGGFQFAGTIPSAAQPGDATISFQLNVTIVSVPFTVSPPP